MKKKFHLVAAFFLIAGATFLNYLPSLRAVKGDIQTFQIRGKDVFRVNALGGIQVSSQGISQPDAGLFVRHESVVLVPSSNSFYLNPPLFITTAGFMNGSTTFTDGATAMAVATTPALTRSIPTYPRTLEILSDSATGFLVVRGTDCFNRGGVTETLLFASNTITATKTCWIGISSITVNFSLSTGGLFTSYGGLTPCSSAYFYIGTSSGFAMPFQAQYSTDVYRVLWGMPTVSTVTIEGLTGQYMGIINQNQSVITTATIVTPQSSTTTAGPNPNPSVIFVSSQAFANSGSYGAATSTPGLGYSSSTLKMDLWAVERKSIYAP